MDFEFGNGLPIKTKYNSSLLIEEICYIGTCVSGSESKDIKNCSIACFEQSLVCYNGEKKCSENKCKETNKKDNESECHEFNRIEKWRDTEMYKDSDIFNIIPYTQIKTKNEVCDKGYRKCGKINKEEFFMS